MNGAQATAKEENPFVDTADQVKLALEKRDDGLYLKTNLYDFVPEKTDGVISTATIPMAFEPEEKYENPDGTPITFDSDYFGNHRDGVKVTAGPFVDGESAVNRLF